MRKYIDDHCCLPKWYGVAWRDYSRRQSVCYPLGINLIAAVIYYLWIKAICPRYIMNHQHAMEEIVQLENENQILKHENDNLACIIYRHAPSHIKETIVQNRLPSSRMYITELKGEA